MHMKLTIETPDINNIDKAFYAYIIQQNKKYDYNLIKCDFKLVSNDYQNYHYITSELSDNKAMCS